MRSLKIKRSSNKLFISKPEIKHSADKTIVTVYVYNRERRFLISKIFSLKKRLYLKLRRKDSLVNRYKTRSSHHKNHIQALDYKKWNEKLHNRRINPSASYNHKLIKIRSIDNTNKNKLNRCSKGLKITKRFINRKVRSKLSGFRRVSKMKNPKLFGMKHISEFKLPFFKLERVINSKKYNFLRKRILFLFVKYILSIFSIKLQVEKDNDGNYINLVTSHGKSGTRVISFYCKKKPINITLTEINFFLIEYMFYTFEKEML